MKTEEELDPRADTASPRTILITTNDEQEYPVKNREFDGRAVDPSKYEQIFIKYHCKITFGLINFVREQILFT